MWFEIHLTDIEEELINKVAACKNYDECSELFEEYGTNDVLGALIKLGRISESNILCGVESRYFDWEVYDDIDNAFEKAE